MISLAYSNTLTSFDKETIGTKVTDESRILDLIGQATDVHDFTKDETPGQGFLMLPEAAIAFVSAGVGKHTHNPKDYVVRAIRGQAEMFLKRDLAAPATGVAAIVYTREAYLADPDVMTDVEESERVENSNYTHIIVAILAFAGPDKPPVGYVRLVKNIAGANNRYAPSDTTVEMIIADAAATDAYHSTWCVVAD